MVSSRIPPCRCPLSLYLSEPILLINDYTRRRASRGKLVVDVNVVKVKPGSGIAPDSGAERVPFNNFLQWCFKDVGQIHLEFVAACHDLPRHFLARRNRFTALGDNPIAGDGMSGEPVGASRREIDEHFFFAPRSRLGHLLYICHLVHWIC